MACGAGRPVASSICAATTACVTYSWDVATFGDCPVGCGLAESALTRDVACMSSANALVSNEALCAGAKIAGLNICAVTTACATYSWDAAAFADCPTDCGLAESTVARTVACMVATVS